MANEEKALEAARVIKEEIGMSEHSIPRVAEIIDQCLTWKDEQFKTNVREWFQYNAWSFAHFVDSQSYYDWGMALENFLKVTGIEDR